MSTKLFMQLVIWLCNGLWFACFSWSSPLDSVLSKPEVATSQSLSNAPLVKNLYLVDNIKVDITSSSSQEARNIAIVDAERKAFAEILKRLLPETEQAKFSNLSDPEIEFMVQDFEISSEKITKIRYIGMFAFRFNPSAVEKVLSGSGHKIQPQMNTATDILVIPLYQNAQHILLWNEANPWFIGWSENTSSSCSDVKTVVPVGDLQDINDLSANDALAGNRTRVAKLLERYNTTQAVIAIYREENQGVMLEVRQFSSSGMVSALGPVSLGEPHIKPTNSIQLAIQKTKEFINQLQKDPTGAVSPQKMVCSIDFTSLSEWIAYKESLETAPIIHNFKINSLSAHQAEVSFDMLGTRAALDTFLSSQGFRIEEGVGDLVKIVRLLPLISPALANEPNPIHMLISPAVAANDIPNQESKDIYGIKNNTFPVHKRTSPYYMPSEVLPQQKTDSPSSAVLQENLSNQTEVKR